MTTRTTTTPEISLSTDVRGFFADLVTHATEDRGLESNEATTAYVAALLADYAHPGAFSRTSLERPFTLLLAEAMETAGHERFERLRAIGDGALYLRGFFREHLETRGVALPYVSAVGARAYDGVATMLRVNVGVSASGNGEGTVPDVFGELAARFDAFVELLETVSDRLVAQGSAGTPGGVLKLYERWMKTGSTDIAAALGEFGLVPQRGSGGLQ
jgi:hypothetical protein